MTPRATNQRGGATLAVTLILFGVITLVVALANRNHLFEQRASANQYRSTQAFEAAEAGLEWATAMLNNPRPLNDSCEDGAGVNFRERYLETTARTRLLRPTTRLVSGHASALRAACVKQGDAWTCACPSNGSPALPIANAGEHPAFIVEFAQEVQSGTVRLLATGCTSITGECSPGSGTTADATAHVQTSLGALPALQTVPLAPLTARDTINVGTSSLGLHNADAASGGFAVHAGGAVLAANARLTTAPGASTESAVIDNDDSLHALTRDRFFTSFFGIGKMLWKRQPGVSQIRCAQGCVDAMIASVRAGHQLIWIDGDVELSGAVQLGTPQRPVAIVATGTARFVGPVHIHGVVYAAALSWQGSGGGRLRGAAISESTYDGNSEADFIYDPAVLDSLNASAGSFARLPGSWRDF